jgi:hypothetical protein
MNFGGITIGNCSFDGVGGAGNTWNNVDNRVFTNVKENGKAVSK